MDFTEDQRGLVVEALESAARSWSGAADLDIVPGQTGTFQHKADEASRLAAALRSGSLVIVPSNRQ